MFAFRRITLFCLEKRLSKHKMTMFSKNFGGACPPLATPMSLHSNPVMICSSSKDPVMLYSKKLKPAHPASFHFQVK